MTTARVGAFVLALALAVPAPLAHAEGPSRPGAPPGAPAPAAPAAVRSEHWTVESAGTEDEAREFLRVLDAAWPQFEALFGGAPALAKGETLRVRFFETAEAMKDAIRKAGGVVPEAGGYYCPVSRTSYAFRQPSRWYTRTLLLHEAAHQFHMRGVAAKSRGVMMPWWVEGIAEHVSHHTWDGTTLRLGVVPLVSLEDRAGALLEASAAAGWTPEATVGAALDRPHAMHLVRFLATSSAGAPVPSWKALARRLDAGEVLKPRDVASAAGGAARLRTEFAAWLRTVQQPFRSEFVEWDSTGPDSMRGTGPVVGICRTKAAATGIEADVTPRDPSKPWRAGLLLRWGGGDDYVIAQLESGVRWFVDERKAGAWNRLAGGDVLLSSAGDASPGDPQGPARAANRAWKLAATREGGDVVLRIEGADVARLPLGAGPLGFCQEGASADFTSIRWR